MARTTEQLREHYELETRLARRILEAAPGRRSAVTRECYDELYRRIGHHDFEELSPEDIHYRDRSARLFARLIGGDRDVLEIGCGIGDRLACIAALGNRCRGVDISSEILEQARRLHPSHDYAVDDATDLSTVPSASCDAVLSSQMLEHLHPEDVPRHLAEVARVLRPGGRYVFDTPSSLMGPTDISGLFGDEVARGFHLKEWTYGELRPLLRAAGFDRLRSPWGRQTTLLNHPGLAPLALLPLEWKLPVESLARRVGRRSFTRLLNKVARLSILVVARRRA